MIQINDNFKKLIPPLTESEYAELEQSILAEGCREALITWNGWICPRESASWNEDKLNIKHASGTPYKKVDFSSLIPFAEFKNVVIERLRLNVRTRRAV